jgi:hypothetical protein
MDRELAEAVFVRWGEGLPVYEGTLYKAASVLGADPGAVLAEARFYHYLDRALERGTGFTAPERDYFSAASGYDPDEMEKTAEACGFESSDNMILRALAKRHFVPDIEKLAFLGMQGGPTDGGPAAAAGSMAPEGGEEGGQPLADAAPQPGAALQQNPLVRPSPTAPGQVPSSEGGNLQELLGAAGETPGADENGGLPPAGAGAEGAPPEQPDAAQRLQQAMPAIPPDALERYAPKLEEFEQQVGMTVMDPKQIEKFIKEMQKADKKIIDEAMKQFGEQNAQQMGVGSQPQWDDTAPKPNGGGGGVGGAASGGAPAPGGAGGGQPPASPDAMAKAAAAGAILARARRR